MGIVQSKLDSQQQKEIQPYISPELLGIAAKVTHAASEVSNTISSLSQEDTDDSSKGTSSSLYQSCKAAFDREMSEEDIDAEEQLISGEIALGVPLFVDLLEESVERNANTRVIRTARIALSNLPPQSFAKSSPVIRSAFARVRTTINSILSSHSKSNAEREDAAMLLLEMAVAEGSLSFALEVAETFLDFAGTLPPSALSTLRRFFVTPLPPTPAASFGRKIGLRLTSHEFSVNPAMTTGSVQAKAAFCKEKPFFQVTVKDLPARSMLAIGVSGASADLDSILGNQEKTVGFAITPEGCKITVEGKTTVLDLPQLTVIDAIGCNVEFRDVAAEIEEQPAGTTTSTTGHSNEAQVEDATSASASAASASSASASVVVAAVASSIGGIGSGGDSGGTPRILNQEPSAMSCDNPQEQQQQQQQQQQQTSSSSNNEDSSNQNGELNQNEDANQPQQQQQQQQQQPAQPVAPPEQIATLSFVINGELIHTCELRIPAEYQLFPTLMLKGRAKASVQLNAKWAPSPKTQILGHREVLKSISNRCASGVRMGGSVIVMTILAQLHSTIMSEPSLRTFESLLRLLRRFKMDDASTTDAEDCFRARALLRTLGHNLREAGTVAGVKGDVFSSSGFESDYDATNNNNSNNSSSTVANVIASILEELMHIITLTPEFGAGQEFEAVQSGAMRALQNGMPLFFEEIDVRNAKLHQLLVDSLTREFKIGERAMLLVLMKEGKRAASLYALSNQLLNNPVDQDQQGSTTVSFQAVFESALNFLEHKMQKGFLSLPQADEPYSRLKIERLSPDSIIVIGQKKKKKNCQVCTYESDFDENGILYYIGSHENGATDGKFANPATAASPPITITKGSNGSEEGHAHLITSRADPVNSWTPDVRSLAYYTIDFGETRRIVPSAYTLRRGGGNAKTKHWNLEGGNIGSDGKMQWKVLKEHVNDDSISETTYGMHTWTIDNPAGDSYQAFKLTMTAAASSNDWFFAVNHFEIYGQYFQNWGGDSEKNGEEGEEDTVVIDDESAVENCIQLVLGMYVVVSGVLFHAKPESKDAAANIRSWINEKMIQLCLASIDEAMRCLSQGKHPIAVEDMLHRSFVGQIMPEAVVDCWKVLSLKDEQLMAKSLLELVQKFSELLASLPDVVTQMEIFAQQPHAAIGAAAANLPPWEHEPLDTKILESSHPYPDSADTTDTVEIAGAAYLTVVFDERCITENNYDYLVISDGKGKIYGGNKLTGSRWPKAPLIIPGSKLVAKFKSDGSTNDWGYKLTISGFNPRGLTLVEQIVESNHPYTAADAHTYTAQIPRCTFLQVQWDNECKLENEDRLTVVESAVERCGSADWDFTPANVKNSDTVTFQLTAESDQSSFGFRARVFGLASCQGALNHWALELQALTIQSLSLLSKRLIMGRTNAKNGAATATATATGTATTAAAASNGNGNNNDLDEAKLNILMHNGEIVEDYEEFSAYEAFIDDGTGKFGDILSKFIPTPIQPQPLIAKTGRAIGCVLLHHLGAGKIVYTANPNSIEESDIKPLLTNIGNTCGKLQTSMIFSVQQAKNRGEVPIDDPSKGYELVCNRAIAKCRTMLRYVPKSSGLLLTSASVSDGKGGGLARFKQAAWGIMTASKVSGTVDWEVVRPFLKVHHALMRLKSNSMQPDDVTAQHIDEATAIMKAVEDLVLSEGDDKVMVSTAKQWASRCEGIRAGLQCFQQLLTTTTMSAPALLLLLDAASSSLHGINEEESGESPSTAHVLHKISGGHIEVQADAIASFEGIISTFVSIVNDPARHLALRLSASRGLISAHNATALKILNDSGIAEKLPGLVEEIFKFRQSIYTAAIDSGEDGVVALNSNPDGIKAMTNVWSLIRIVLLQASCFSSQIPAAFAPKMVDVASECLSGWVREQHSRPCDEPQEERRIPLRFSWNPSRAFSDVQFADDNRTSWRSNSSGWGAVYGSPAIESGCHYFEFRLSGTDSNYLYVGLAYDDCPLNDNYVSNNIVWRKSGSIRLHGDECGDPGAFNMSDVVGIGIDMDARTVHWYKNGVRLLSTPNLRPQTVYPFVSYGSSELRITFAEMPIPPTDLLVTGAASNTVLTSDQVLSQKLLSAVYLSSHDAVVANCLRTDKWIELLLTMAEAKISQELAVQALKLLQHILQRWVNIPEGTARVMIHRLMQLVALSSVECVQLYAPRGRCSHPVRLQALRMLGGKVEGDRGSWTRIVEGMAQDAVMALMPMLESEANTNTNTTNTDTNTNTDPNVASDTSLDASASASAASASVTTNPAPVDLSVESRNRIGMAFSALSLMGGARDALCVGSEVRTVSTSQQGYFISSSGSAVSISMGGTDTVSVPLGDLRPIPITESLHLIDPAASISVLQKLIEVDFIPSAFSTCELSFLSLRSYGLKAIASCLREPQVAIAMIKSGGAAKLAVVATMAARALPTMMDLPQLEAKAMACAKSALARSGGVSVSLGGSTTPAPASASASASANNNNANNSNNAASNNNSNNSGTGGNVSRTNSTGSAASGGGRPVNISRPEVSELAVMGFKEAWCLRALESSSWNKERAAEWILEHLQELQVEDDEAAAAEEEEETKAANPEVVGDDNVDGGGEVMFAGAISKMLQELEIPLQISPDAEEVIRCFVIDVISLVCSPEPPANLKVLLEKMQTSLPVSMTEMACAAVSNAVSSRKNQQGASGPFRTAGLKLQFGISDDEVLFALAALSEFIAGNCIENAVKILEECNSRDEDGEDGGSKKRKKKNNNNNNNNSNDSGSSVGTGNSSGSEDDDDDDDDDDEEEEENSGSENGDGDSSSTPRIGSPFDEAHTAPTDGEEQASSKQPEDDKSLVKLSHVEEVFRTDQDLESLQQLTHAIDDHVLKIASSDQGEAVLQADRRTVSTQNVECSCVVMGVRPLSISRPNRVAFKIDEIFAIPEPDAATAAAAAANVSAPSPPMISLGAVPPGWEPPSGFSAFSDFSDKDTAAALVSATSVWWWDDQIYVDGKIVGDRIPSINANLASGETIGFRISKASGGDTDRKLQFFRGDEDVGPAVKLPISAEVCAAASMKGMSARIIDIKSAPVQPLLDMVDNLPPGPFVAAEHWSRFSGELPTSAKSVVQLVEPDALVMHSKAETIMRGDAREDSASHTWFESLHALGLLGSMDPDDIVKLAFATEKEVATLQARRGLLQLLLSAIKHKLEGVDMTLVPLLLRLCAASWDGNSLVNVPSNSAELQELVHTIAGQEAESGSPDGVMLLLKECVFQLQRGMMSDKRCEAHAPYRILESPHPYDNDMSEEGYVSIPGAEKLLLTFDPRCKTESGCDKLKLFSDSARSAKLAKLHGSDWQSSMTIKASDFYWKFTSDSSNTEWGYRILVEDAARASPKLKNTFLEEAKTTKPKKEILKTELQLVREPNLVFAIWLFKQLKNILSKSKSLEHEEIVSGINTMVEAAMGSSVLAQDEAVRSELMQISSQAMKMCHGKLSLSAAGKELANKIRFAAKLQLDQEASSSAAILFSRYCRSLVRIAAATHQEDPEFCNETGLLGDFQRLCEAMSSVTKRTPLPEWFVNSLPIPKPDEQQDASDAPGAEFREGPDIVKLAGHGSNVYPNEDARRFTIANRGSTWQTSCGNVVAKGGCFMFEVRIGGERGNLCIGWAKPGWEPAEGSYVGGDANSWGFFVGKNQSTAIRHNNSSSPFGRCPGDDDVIGCWVDLTKGMMGFAINGDGLGVAFRGLPTDGSGIVPVIAFSESISCVNFGGGMNMNRGFWHPLTILDGKVVVPSAVPVAVAGSPTGAPAPATADTTTTTTTTTADATDAAASASADSGDKKATPGRKPSSLFKKWGKTGASDPLPCLSLNLIKGPGPGEEKLSRESVNVGDVVRIIWSSRELEQLAEGHGGWNSDMARTVGTEGRVRESASSSIQVETVLGESWHYNPSALIRTTLSGEPEALPYADWTADGGFGNDNWTAEQDIQLVSFANEKAAASDNPGGAIKMSPEQLLPRFGPLEASAIESLARSPSRPAPFGESAAEFVSNPGISRSHSLKARMVQLSSHSHAAMRARFVVLKKINELIVKCLPLLMLDETSDDRLDFITSTLLGAKSIVFFGTKESVLNNAVRVTMGGKRANITINRGLAARAAESAQAGRCRSEGLRSVFGQIFQALQRVPPSQLRLKERVWEVKFLGEGATDAGGPYRETISNCCADLMSENTPLFVLCPNGRADQGFNRDLRIPNPDALSTRCMAMFRFVGVLMGIAIRTRHPLDLYLPSFFWRPLVGDANEIQDLSNVDHAFVQILENIRNCDNALAWESLEQTWTVVSATGREKELVQGGREKPVLFEERDAFYRAAVEFRLKECQCQIEAIREGFATIIPINFITLMTSKEIELTICGHSEIDLELLKQHTDYSSCSGTDAAVKRFWEVLESFTQEDRRQFLGFVWGRTRLPRRGDSWPQKFSLTINRRDNARLPTAATCSFSATIPAYSSSEIMRDKLLYAIHNTKAIDTDFAATGVLGEEGDDEEE